MPAHRAPAGVHRRGPGRGHRAGLRAAGYDFTLPAGAFYLFPKSPFPDESRFVDLLKRLATGDPDPDVRAAAAQLAGGAP